MIGRLAVALLLAQAPGPRTYIRVNQLGYLPSLPKVAVVCSLERARIASFLVRDEAGRVVLRGRAVPANGFGPCVSTYRLDFSAVRKPGRYRLEAGESTSPVVRVDAAAYRGAADVLLGYLRQQRSRWNPVLRDSVHVRDGIVVDDSEWGGRHVDVSGGWADAADYLQYVTTSATATFMLLQSYRDHPAAFGDAFQADGLPGRNGMPDVLDEARWGLEWLLRMAPEGGPLFNQIADDRDHRLFDLPDRDTVNYGWGSGGARPVYPCTGRPQGLFRHRNRSDGKASTAGKFTSAFALGAAVFRALDPAFSRELATRAADVYRVGVASPGVCQTAPAVSPYFYEEANWTDDMELGAAELFALTRSPRYLTAALAYAAREPVTPWMGRDTARHYEWYPWHNNGHYEIFRQLEKRGKAPPAVRERARLARWYREGLQRVVRRADNGFLIGVPFIWCSNDLVASFATQALLYRRMTGDRRFLPYEMAAIDWLFGTNPWGTSMVIGLPRDGIWPHDPQSAVAMRLGVDAVRGGVVDGPVYRSIYENLRGIRLDHPDAFAPFNTGRVVYHDDLGDYSTNEPTLDGTANLLYVLSSLGDPRQKR